MHKAMETIIDDYKEHELHANRIKGISARTCSECYKEYQKALKKIKKPMNSPLTRHELGLSY